MSDRCLFSEDEHKLLRELASTRLVGVYTQGGKLAEVSSHDGASVSCLGMDIGKVIMIGAAACEMHKVELYRLSVWEVENTTVLCEDRLWQPRMNRLNLESEASCFSRLIGQTLQATVRQILEPVFIGKQRRKIPVDSELLLQSGVGGRVSIAVDKLIPLNVLVKFEETSELDH